MIYRLVIETGTSRVTRDCSTHASASLCFIQAVAGMLEDDGNCYTVTMLNTETRETMWEAQS